MVQVSLVDPNQNHIFITDILTVNSLASEHKIAYLSITQYWLNSFAWKNHLPLALDFAFFTRKRWYTFIYRYKAVPCYAIHSPELALSNGTFLAMHYTAFFMEKEFSYEEFSPDRNASFNKKRNYCECFPCLANAHRSITYQALACFACDCNWLARLTWRKWPLNLISVCFLMRAMRKWAHVCSIKIIRTK